MKFEIDVFLPSQKDLLEKFGLDENGRTQKVVDTSFMHYMKLKMPQDSGAMIQNTISPKGGLVLVNVPYAHYMNEGILYVDSITGKGAFHDEISDRYWSRPNTKKVPSNRKLNYHGGADKGSHFVERTVSENFDDIVREAQKEIDKL